MRIDEWTGFEVSDVVLQEAAQWIAELDTNTNNAQLGLDEASDAASDEANHLTRQLAFYDWLGQDPSHQQAYAELSEIWAKTACMKSMSAAIRSSQVVEFPSKIIKPFEIPLFPKTKSTSPNFESKSFASAWVYSASMALIVVGLFVPAFQSIL